MIVATRSHEFCYGHRVFGHENKCANLHGHNGKVTFSVESIYADGHALDQVGRVVDFAVIKERLCDWIETNWDHKMLLWEKDPFDLNESSLAQEQSMGIVRVPFNPTAENMALYLLNVVGPKVLHELPIKLTLVDFYETSKCAVIVSSHV